MNLSCVLYYRHLLQSVRYVPDVGNKPEPLAEEVEALLYKYSVL